MRILWKFYILKEFWFWFKIIYDLSSISALLMTKIINVANNQVRDSRISKVGINF